MTSGEIAKKVGISQKAVRLYDEKGLLKPSDYSEGNYRLYDKEAILVLEKIIALKHIGFTLEEIYDSLIAGKNMNIVESLNEQLEIMEKKKAEIERTIVLIKGLLARTNGNPDWNNVAELACVIRQDQQADESHYHALKHSVNNKDWYEMIYETLGLSENSAVLDLGCGFGKLWRNNWARIPKNVKINAVDLKGGWADNFCEFINEHKNELSSNTDISINWKDVEGNDLWNETDEKYDYVIAHYLLEFINDVELFIKHTSEVLAIDGMFSCNGFTESDEHQFWKEILESIGLKTGFISEKIKEEEKISNEFKSLLSKYFSNIEIVGLENNMKYEDSDEIFEKLCERYVENKKYLLDNENIIKEYFEDLVDKKGEVIITNTSKFWHCFK